MPSLPFRWFIPSGRSQSPSYNVVNYDDDSDAADDDDQSPSDEPATVLGAFSLAPRSSSQSHLLLPRLANFAGSSQPGSVAGSPLPSRCPSPNPPSQFYSTPIYTSTSEDEASSPILVSAYGRRRKWWPRRRKHEIGLKSWRGWKRMAYKMIKHPLFPTQPLTILLTLLLFTTFALLLTVSLIYILNPDKYPLPWRQYCSHPTAAAFPPKDFESIPPAGLFLGVFSMDAAVERRMLVRTTWASHVRSRGMDGATDRTVVRFILGKPRPEWERRVGLEMQVYNDIIVLPMSENMNNGKTHAFFTWAHEHALVPPPNTNHTFNPVHRLPLPPKIPVPASPETSSDEESSTSLSSSAAVSDTTSSAAATESVQSEPRSTFDTTTSMRHRTGPPPSIFASHDPRRVPSALSANGAGASHSRTTQKRRLLGLRKVEIENWVAPDFVIKADDDSFVMLAELEGRLRVEWADALMDGVRKYGQAVDPLIFWGYLVKSRFMAGELYALSSALVSYIATNPKLLSMTRGAEDKTTSKWIRLHPQADQIRWRSEHCWIYDHPRAGTVYSHGFLFPSEAERVGLAVEEAKELLKNTTAATKSWIGSSTVKPEVAALMSDPGLMALSTSSSGAASSTSDDASTTVPLPISNPLSWDPDSWVPGPPSPASTPLPPSSPFLSHSTVTRFATRYTLPMSNLTIPMQVEALVEGSGLSRLRSHSRMDNSTSSSTGDEAPKWEDAMRAWEGKETYDQRYARSTLRARGVQLYRAGDKILPPSVEMEDEEEEKKPADDDRPESMSVYGPRGIGLGGTVVVHFIKRNEWFLEAAMALLGPNWNGDEGRIDPGTEKTVVDPAKVGTVIAKTHSFRRGEEDVAPCAEEKLS